MAEMSLADLGAALPKRQGTLADFLAPYAMRAQVEDRRGQVLNDPLTVYANVPNPHDVMNMAATQAGDGTPLARQAGISDIGTAPNYGTSPMVSAGYDGLPLRMPSLMALLLKSGGR